VTVDELFKIVGIDLAALTKTARPVVRHWKAWVEASSLSAEQALSADGYRQYRAALEAASFKRNTVWTYAGIIRAKVWGPAASAGIVDEPDNRIHRNPRVPIVMANIDPMGPIQGGLSEIVARLKRVESAVAVNQIQYWLRVCVDRLGPETTMECLAGARKTVVHAYKTGIGPGPLTRQVELLFCRVRATMLEADGVKLAVEPYVVVPPGVDHDPFPRKP
jgi:hypothetical protein